MDATKPLTAAQRMRVQAVAGMPVAVSPDHWRNLAWQIEHAERLFSAVKAQDGAITMQRRIIAVWQLIAAAQTVLIVAMVAIL